MSTITRERAQEIFLGNGPEPTASEERELARMALASLEAEPVTQVLSSRAGNDTSTIDKALPEGTMLHTAPPAPVSVPEGVANAIESLKQTLVDCNRYNYCFDAVKRVEDACRAAMLQGAGNSESQHAVKALPLLNSSVKDIELQHADTRVNADSNSPVVPDGWVLVPVDMPHEMMRAVQVNSELGAYAATNLNGAYSLFREFWDVAVTAAPQQE